MDVSDYDKVCGPLGVLNGAVSIPAEVSEAVGRLLFGSTGEVVSQEIGIGTDLYSLVGTIPLHLDAYFEQGEEGFCAMGLVLLNEADTCLTDGENILPLPVGTVFRHDPCSFHGTCLADGTATDQGRLVFISVDFELNQDPEDTPAAFAEWALEDTIEKLTELGLLSNTFGR